MKANEKTDSEANLLVTRLMGVREYIRTHGWVKKWTLGFGILLLLILGYRYLQGNRAYGLSEQAMALDHARTEAALKEYAEKYKDSDAWKAKLQLARIALTDNGMEKFRVGSKENRDKAIASIEAGVAAYRELIPQLDPEPALKQEAYLSIARAEQFLMLAKDAQGKPKGSLDKAIEAMKQAAAILPESAASKNYLKQIEEMTAKRGEIEKFYTDLSNSFFTPAVVAPKEENPLGTPPKLDGPPLSIPDLPKLPTQP